MLNHLWHRGTEFLGTPYAILGGAMTWLSNHELVAAISEAGGFGVLACGAMSPALLDLEIQKTQEKTSKLFGVNLIILHPDLDDLIEVCGQRKISHVILAGGIPSQTSIQKLKERGCKVIGFASALILARKLLKLGIDALIIEGHEAGGHIGPVSTSVLAQEILPVIQEIPIFVAGGIGCGAGMAMYLQMGASGCQLGTRFVCAKESPAHPDFKKAFIRAQARDAVSSVQLDPRFPVIPVRALANNATQAFQEIQAQAIHKHDQGELSLKEAQLMIEHFWAGALRRAVVEGDIENGSLMAGQSVGFVTKEQTVKEIFEELLGQALQFLEKKKAG